MKKVLFALVVIGSLSPFAKANAEPAQAYSACRDGSTATGWICGGYNNHHNEITVPVLLVCRNGQWVYDPSMNGGYVSPPSCNR